MNAVPGQDMTIRGLSVFMALGLTSCLTFAQQAGDLDDGNRSVYAHRIGLYAEDSTGFRGPKITPDAQPQVPFSITQSCNQCHDVNIIAQGMHFNMMDTQVGPGRKSEPWIYADPSLGVQIPLSYRAWPHTLLPDQVGLSDQDFVQQFAHHLPGGGPLEINCLVCHSQDARVDLGGAGGYGDRLRRGQLSWAVTASSGVVTVSGGWGDTQPSAHYSAAIFDDHNDVFLDLTKQIEDQRCEYCHSTTWVNVQDSRDFRHDPDVHQIAGLRCVDCHQATLDHKMSSGALSELMDTNSMGKDLLTCRGCHLGNPYADQPTAGRLGAPVPQHKGIPLLHFEKLACVTCHSGPWPEDTVGQVKTSRSHQLGTTFGRKACQALPHVYYPVYAKGADHRIVPCKMIWPAYWGFLSDGQVTPVPVARVRMVARQVIKPRFISEEGNWPALTEEHVVDMLRGLGTLEDTAGEPVYVCGGLIHKRDDKAQLMSMKHSAAEPCLWPAGHAVRPASQALGVRTCRDCHHEESAFFFGQVPVDSLLASDQGRVVSMIEFQQLDPVWAHRFGKSFKYRDSLKGVLFVAGGVLVVTLLCFGFRAVYCVAKALGKRDGV